VFNKVRIELKFVRRGEIVGPIPFKLAGHPLLAPLKEVTLAPAASDGAVDLDLSQVKLPPGAYDLYAETLAKVKYAGRPTVTELSASFYSSPIRLLVTPAPIALTPPAAPVSVEAGGKVEVPIRITRLYGYTDPVDVTLVATNVKGVSGKAAIAKDQAEAKLPIQADASTPAGDYPLKLQATLKLNNQPITVEQPITIKVTAKPAPK
jgi:hypothetical protein